MQNNEFNQNDLADALANLKMLKFFPADEVAHAAIMRLLAKMCPHKTAVKWLVDTLVNQVGAWPGPAEVRGLLCTRYRPADGVEAWCSLPGYSGEDCESQPPMSVSEARERLAEVAPKLLEARKL